MPELNLLDPQNEDALDIPSFDDETSIDGLDDLCNSLDLIQHDRDDELF